VRRARDFESGRAVERVSNAIGTAAFVDSHCGGFQQRAGRRRSRKRSKRKSDGNSGRAVSHYHKHKAPVGRSAEATAAYRAIGTTTGASGAGRTTSGGKNAA